MRRLGLDIVVFVVSFAIQVFSAYIPKVSVVELRQRNHCFPALTNSSKMTNSYLWRIVRDPPVYFFGTIHVPYTRVWDYIPENAKQAFRESDHAFFELDLTDVRTTHTLRRCQMLPRGENLSTVLPERMYKRLKNHLGYVEQMMPTWGVYDEGLFHAIAGNWERKRPVWVMLMVNTLNEADMKSRGIPVLDYYLTLEAKRMDKGVGAVEYVQEQCIPFNGLNVSQVLFLLNRTLWQQEALREGTVQNSFTTDDLIWHYNCGDLNSMIFSLDTAQIPNVLNSTMSQAEIALAQEIDRYFVNELIDKRNQNMASRIKEIVDSNEKESFFFAFGAGHFLGNNSVLDLLRAEGYVIENIPADVDLDSLTSNSISGTGQGPNEHRSTQQWDNADKNSHFNELWVHIDEVESETPVYPNEALQRIATTVPCSHNGAVSGLQSHPLGSSTFLLLLLSIMTAILLTGTRST